MTTIYALVFISLLLPLAMLKPPTMSVEKKLDRVERPVIKGPLGNCMRLADEDAEF